MVLPQAMAWVQYWFRILKNLRRYISTITSRTSQRVTPLRVVCRDLSPCRYEPRPGGRPQNAACGPCIALVIQIPAETALVLSGLSPCRVPLPNPVHFFFNSCPRCKFRIGENENKILGFLVGINPKSGGGWGGGGSEWSYHHISYAFGILISEVDVTNRSNSILISTITTCALQVYLFQKICQHQLKQIKGPFKGRPNK